MYSYFGDTTLANLPWSSVMRSQAIRSRTRTRTTTRTKGGFMGSLLSFFACMGDRELRTGETAPPRRCRHLDGSAFLRLVCRQDAGSTL